MLFVAFVFLSMYEFVSYISESLICVEGASGTGLPDLCQGDSGGWFFIMFYILTWRLAFEIIHLFVNTECFIFQLGRSSHVR